MFIVFCCLFYFLFGAFLSLPYCLLAGWDRGFFPVMVVATPFLLGVWFLAVFFVGAVDFRPTRICWRNFFYRSRRESSRVPLAIFWIWTVYSMLPILMHWTARFVEYLGFGSSAAFIEVHRFESLLYVFWGVMVVFSILMVFGGVSEAVARLTESRKNRLPNGG
jgi:hypothetical protein